MGDVTMKTPLQSTRWLPRRHHQQWYQETLIAMNFAILQRIFFASEAVVRQFFFDKMVEKNFHKMRTPVIRPH